MSHYRTIKELVIKTYNVEGTFPSCETLTSLVKQHFPDSLWKDSQYAWYKSQIKTGKIPVSNSLGSNGDDKLNQYLRSYLATEIHKIESGLCLIENGDNYQTEVGKIDLLARDTNNQLVAIGLKSGQAQDGAIGELLGLMGCLTASESNVRGILVAPSFDSRVVCAAKALPTVKLVKYQPSFILQEVN